MLLPDTSRLGAFVVAERIRRRIEERFARSRAPVTLSGGIAVFPDDAGAPADLIVQADAGLYGAKASGKNRILLPQGERRRFRRLPAPQRVTLATEAARTPVSVKNLSEGGLLVSLREAVAVGSAVSLTIERADAAPVGPARRGRARRAGAGGGGAGLRRGRALPRPGRGRSAPLPVERLSPASTRGRSRAKIGGWASSPHSSWASPALRVLPCPRGTRSCALSSARSASARRRSPSTPTTSPRRATSSTGRAGPGDARRAPSRSFT